MQNTYFISDADHMLQHGEKLASCLLSGDVIFLQGNLGMGKTTLARGILRGLGHPGHVKSPTYTIVEPYLLGELSVYHFDLYRITSPQELLDMGFYDYLSSEAILLVEWPEKASVLLPEPTLLCQLSSHKESRSLVLQASTAHGNKLIAEQLR